MSRKKRKAWKILLAVLLLPPILFISGLYAYYNLPYDDRSRDVIVDITKGETLGEISRQLAEKRLVRFPQCFVFLARLLDRDRFVRTGRYRLLSSMSPREILESLCRGVVLLRRVTVPEGMTVKRVADILQKNGLADREEVFEAERDREFLKQLGIEGDSLEGFLFPDTYHFAVGLPCRDILRTMVTQFWSLYDPGMRARQESLGLKTSEVVTMASIIEKETSRREEKPLIASVLHNRLRKTMPLQCDPTVIYGIENFDGNLRRVHLETPNPYNTYLNRGLPPGPICNPGLDSIKAVLDPEETPYLYFVSKNNGTHHFSARIEDHNRAVQKYQKRRRK